MNIIYPKAKEEKIRYQERYELAAERVREIADRIRKDLS